MRQNAIFEPTNPARDDAGAGAEPHDRLAGGADAQQAPTTNRSADRTPRRFAGRLARDRRGGIALIFALTLLPIAVGAGLALDLGRAYIVESRLAYALDAAGLAVGSSSGSDAELQVLLQSYFDANYPAAELGIPATPSMSIIGDEIHLSAAADIGTMLMGIVGVHNIAVAADSVIIREVKGIEVVLVLDNTGSMSGSKMTSLKDASTELIDILFGDQTLPALLKVGIVPFSPAVNIDASNAALLTALNPADFSPDVWRGCVEARTYPHDSRDTSTGVGGSWPPYLYASNSSNNWPSVSGSRGQVRGPNKNCAVSLLPLTNVKQDLLDKITSMEARGTTHINLGAVWGWRLLSPDPPFTEGLPFNDDENTKAIIIMTDGANYISSSGNGYSAYGSLSEGRLGTTSKSAAEAVLDTRLAEVCSEMKTPANNIIVYTITFQVSSSSARTLMQNCASDVGKYFDSPSSAALQSAFRSIAQELSNLRIGR